MPPASGCIDENAVFLEVEAIRVKDAAGMDLDLHGRGQNEGNLIVGASQFSSIRAHLCPEYAIIWNACLIYS